MFSIEFVKDGNLKTNILSCVNTLLCTHRLLTTQDVVIPKTLVVSVGEEVTTFPYFIWSSNGMLSTVLPYLSALPDGEVIVFYIEDDGRGFPTSEHQEEFNKAFTIDRDYKKAATLYNKRIEGGL